VGLIEKSVRKRSNQKLAAEVFTHTALSFDQVEAAVRGYCDAKNAEMTEHLEKNQAKARTRFGKWTASLTDPATYHYYVSPHPETRQILIGFGQRPEPILAGKGNTLSGVWAARLSYPAAGNTVGLALLKWVVGGNDGALKNRSFYEILLQDLYEQISSEAPQGGGASPASSGNSGLPVPQPAPAQAAAPHSAAPQALAEPAPRQTSELLRRERIELGDWAAGLAAAYPFLEYRDFFGLAAMRALLAVDTGFFSSTYTAAKTFTAAQMYASSTHSVLRVRWIMPGGQMFLDCGAPAPSQTFATDWQIRCTHTENGGAMIEVPHHLETNHQVRSAELLDRMRGALKQSLTAGIDLHLVDGPPILDNLITVMPAVLAGYPDFATSPFSGDHLSGVTDAYRTPLVLSPSAGDIVLRAMPTSSLPLVPGSGQALAVASLAGGRPFDAGQVVLWKTGDVCQLTIEIPDGLPPAERERSYRAALRFLRDIREELKQSEPDLSAAVGAHLDHIAEQNQAAWRTSRGGRPKDRQPGLWLSNWDKTTSAPMVPVATGRRYPVAIRVTTSGDANYLTRATQAANWATALKRAQPVLNEAGRPTNRVSLSARRCCMVRNEKGQTIPCIRFVSDNEIGDYGLTAAKVTQPWFWELNTRNIPGDDAALDKGGLLLTIGWSHADGVLSYGENLLQVLRAFADVVTATDSQARIQTLYLAN
jgi:hypothetical protein